MQRTVTLSDGTEAKVTELRYGAYKKIKRAVLAALGEQITDVIAISNDGTVSLDREKMAALAPQIGEVLDQINEEFVAGCLEDPAILQRPDLTYADMAALTRAAQELTPIEKVLELEKNSPAGALVRRLVDTIAAGRFTASTSTTGGSDWNQDLYDLAGAQATSSASRGT